MSEPETVVCRYCNHAVTPMSSTPHAQNGPKWLELSTEHAPDCEWIVTRARQRLPVALFTVHLDISKSDTATSLFPLYISYVAWFDQDDDVDMWIVGVPPENSAMFLEWLEKNNAVYKYEQGAVYTA